MTAVSTLPFIVMHSEAPEAPEAPASKCFFSLYTSPFHVQPLPRFGHLILTFCIFELSSESLLNDS